MTSTASVPRCGALPQRGANLDRRLAGIIGSDVLGKAMAVVGDLVSCQDRQDQKGEARPARFGNAGRVRIPGGYQERGIAY